MEQIRSLKKTLTLDTFMPVYLGPFQLYSYEFIVSCSILSLLLTFFSGAKLWIYVINGLFLPLYVLERDYSLKDYWPWLSVLLMIRMVVVSVPALDVLVE